MHAAPPVSVRGTGGPAWRAVQAILPGLATGALGAWALAHLGWPLLPAALAALATAGWAWRLAAPVLAAVVWDGQRWTIDGQAADLQLMIDLDRWVLLRCRPQGQARAKRWLAVAASEAGTAWPLLRAALHAHPPLAPAAGPVEHV